MDNARKIPGQPGSIMMGIAAVLFCLVLFTTHLTGGLYARYCSTGDGADSARVAEFGLLTLTETGDFDGTEFKKGMIIPGVDLTKDVRVSFEGSEMATVVFVEVTLSDKWEEEKGLFSVGSDLSWAVAEGWKRLETPGYVYYQILAPNEPLESVAFIAEGGRIAVSDRITEATIGNLEGTFITVQASVIQAGRVISAEEAWTALQDR